MSDGIGQNAEIVSDNGSIVTVKLFCDGCGDEIETVEMFRDQLGTLPERPLHDKVSCSEEARA